MSRRCTREQWLSVKEDVLAVASLPTHYRVDIFRNPIDAQVVGLCEVVNLEKGHFKIQIEYDLTVHETAEALIHELAHVLDWGPTNPRTTNHGPTFWIRLGEIWTAYYQVR